MAPVVFFLACLLYFVQGKPSNINNGKPVEYYEMGKVDLLYTKLQQRQMKTRSMYLTVVKWANNTIPYIVDSDFESISSRMAALNQAIQDYKENTCIRFVARTNEQNYVKFINGAGCYSYLGVNGGEQEISYGNGCDTTRGTPVHEIMHALGFMHEQQRSDRDSYVTVNLTNVVTGAVGNFKKVNEKDVDLTMKYDLNSVMHYAKWAFSKNGLNTIVPKDSKQLDKIGQRNFFSACDIAKINKFYKCSGYKTTC